MSDPSAAANSPSSSATSALEFRNSLLVNGFFEALSRSAPAPVASRIAVVLVGNCISLCTWCKAKRGSFARSVSRRPGSNAFAKPSSDYHLMQELIEEVSELEWKRLQEKKR